MNGKTNTTAALALALALDAGSAHAQTSSVSRADLQSVSPALGQYATDVLENGLWKRPGLSPRDRSLATLAGVIATDQTIMIKPEMARALDNGVSPAEVSEVITHLAFYAGWGRAMNAIGAAKELFAARGVEQSQLPSSTPDLVPLNEKAEALRAETVEKSVGPASPGLVRDTTDVLFHNLWLRPGLKPRDRSLITVSALIATGQAEQIPFHLGRAMDSGLTREEVSETVSQLAYYAGWPKAFSAAPFIRGVIEKRSPGEKN